MKIGYLVKNVYTIFLSGSGGFTPLPSGVRPLTKTFLQNKFIWTFIFEMWKYYFKSVNLFLYSWRLSVHTEEINSILYTFTSIEKDNYHLKENLKKSAHFSKPVCLETIENSTRQYKYI